LSTGDDINPTKSHIFGGAEISCLRHLRGITYTERVVKAVCHISSLFSRGNL